MKCFVNYNEDYALLLKSEKYAMSIEIDFLEWLGGPNKLILY